MLVIFDFLLILHFNDYKFTKRMAFAVHPPRFPDPFPGIPAGGRVS